MRFYYFIFSIFFLLPSCSDRGVDPSITGDAYLVFGIYHNFCVGDCWHLFKIEGGQLYADDFDHPRNGDIAFKSEAMSSEALSNAAPLLEVPAVVRNSNAEVYGCPDCADQGGYYLEFVHDGVIRVVNFDTRFDGFEEQSIIDYLNDMSAIINSLRQ